MKRLPLILGGVAVFALLCGLTGWRVLQAVNRRSDAGEATAGLAATPVEVAPAITRDLVEEVQVAGALRALHEADVVAQVPGQVESILADVGDTVAAGQALAHLDDDDLALGVRQAEAALAAAKAGQTTAARDLAGGLAVAEVGGVSDAQVIAMQSRSAGADAQVAQADAALGMARARLADATLRAPFSGVVVRRKTDIGAQVSPGLPAFGVADLSELELVLDVDERIAARVKPGDLVPLSSDLVPALADGTVRTVSPMLDAATHKAQIVVRLAFAPGLFGHGGASATFKLGHVEGAVAVPRGALVDDKGEHVVFVVDGTVARRLVVVPGLRDRDWVEVSGVAPGSLVVVTGNAYLSDGATVATHGGEPS